jgi:hypothetical protein
MANNNKQIDAILAKCPDTFTKTLKEMLARQPWDYSKAITVKAKTWRPNSESLIIIGDLIVDGNILVWSEVPTDDTRLIVLGNLKCRNLALPPQATLLCSGNIEATEAILCGAADCISIAAGKVQAHLLDSGSGAWLELFNKKQLQVKNLTAYVMIGDQAIEPKKKANLADLIAKQAIDYEDWDEMDPEDREDEDPADYIHLDIHKAMKILAQGKSILKSKKNK